MKKKTAFSFLLMCCFVVFLSSCSLSKKDAKNISENHVTKMVMLSDLGGVNDQSFNQSAWEGLQNLKTEFKDSLEVSYAEPKQTSDFSLILDKLADGDYNLIYAIGYALSEPLQKTANLNPEKNFVMVDYDFGKNILSNVTSVKFYSQEPAFLAGHIAVMTTKTNKIGFLGGIKSDIIDQFEYGFKAGIKYAEKELKKEIKVETQYAESFTDIAKGKAIGSKLYTNGCDIVFHAAGPVGLGLIESAKEHQKYVIGVDRDQSDIAPECVLTSAIKNVGKAAKLIGKRFINGEQIAGKTLTFGVKEDCVGIPTDHRLMSESTYNSALSLLKEISDGKINIKDKNGNVLKTLTIPYDEKTYTEYLKAF